MTGQEVADAINDIIKHMKIKDFSDEAINWGDLSVNDIVISQSIYPELSDQFIEVIIDEADPSSVKFCNYIAEKFYKKYKIEIYVRTEW